MVVTWPTHLLILNNTRIRNMANVTKTEAKRNYRALKNTSHKNRNRVEQGELTTRADAEDVAGYRAMSEKGILAFILGLECASR